MANSSGAVSNIASLTVNGPAATPAIASLSPNPMTGSSSSQTLTITGMGFTAGDTVQAAYSGGAIGTLQILGVSATQIPGLHRDRHNRAHLDGAGGAGDPAGGPNHARDNCGELAQGGKHQPDPHHHWDGLYARQWSESGCRL